MRRLRQLFCRHRDRIGESEDFVIDWRCNVCGKTWQEPGKGAAWRYWLDAKHALGRKMAEAGYER